MSRTPVPPGRWFKSSRSDSNAQCVEVRLGVEVGVRDSKDRGGPALAVDAVSWAAFVGELKAGWHDLG